MSFCKQSVITVKINTLITTRSWPILDVLGTSVTRTIVYDDHESLLKITTGATSSSHHSQPPWLVRDSPKQEPAKKQKVLCRPSPPQRAVGQFGRYHDAIVWAADRLRDRAAPTTRAQRKRKMLPPTLPSPARLAVPSDSSKPRGARRLWSASTGSGTVTELPS